MKLEDLSDDVLYMIVEHVEWVYYLRCLSQTSRRMYNIARHVLMSREYSEFWVGVHWKDHHVNLARDLVRLITNPGLSSCVRRISTCVGPHAIRPPETWVTEKFCELVYRLQLSSPHLSRQVRTILHVLESDFVHLVDGQSWVRMCMNAIYAVVWLCPAVQELRLRGGDHADVVEQMQDIGSRVRLRQRQTVHSEKPEPYGQLTSLLNIRRLQLDELSCSAIHGHLDAFVLFFIPSLRRVKIKYLNMSEWRHDHFWPIPCNYVCTLTEVVVNFEHELPSPLVIADLLSRCPSLKRFELRTSFLGAECEYFYPETYVEAINSLANKALHDASRPEVKGLPGYADLIRSSLGRTFEDMQYRLGCFLPCSRSKHRELQPRCECVVVSIIKQ